MDGLSPNSSKRKNNLKKFSNINQRFLQLNKTYGKHGKKIVKLER